MLSPSPVASMPSPTVVKATLSGKNCGGAGGFIDHHDEFGGEAEAEADPPALILEAPYLLESGHPWHAILNAAEVARERDIPIIKSPPTNYYGSLAPISNNIRSSNNNNKKLVCAKRIGSSTLAETSNENENINNNNGQQQYDEIIFDDDDDDDDSTTSSQQENHRPQQPPPPTTRQRQLPPGWTEHYDPKSGKPYYYNDEQCLTTWDRQYISKMHKEKTANASKTTKADEIAAAIAAAVARCSRKRTRRTAFFDDNNMVDTTNYVPPPKQSRSIPIEVWSGPPDEELSGTTKKWPEGWVKKLFERQSGKTKGTVDRYWYSPKMQYKLRSMNEVNRFLAALKRNGGDEDKAKRSIS